MIKHVLIDIFKGYNTPVYHNSSAASYYYKLDAYGWYADLIKDDRISNEYNTNLPLQYFEKVIFKYLSKLPIEEDCLLVLSAPAPNKLELYNSFRFGLIVYPGKAGDAFEGDLISFLCDVASHNLNASE